MSTPVGVFVSDAGDVIILKHVTDAIWDRNKIKLSISTLAGKPAILLVGKEAERFITDLICYYELLERPPIRVQENLEDAKISHRVRRATKEEQELDCCSDRYKVNAAYVCSCGAKKCDSCMRSHIFHLHLDKHDG